MAYKVIVSPRAQKEIESAIDYYALLSVKAAQNFINCLQDAYKTLEVNPFFSVRYNNIRALKLKKFPFLFTTLLMKNRQGCAYYLVFKINKTLKKDLSKKLLV